MPDDSFYPPENYYRVSIKALIFDENNRLLVCRDADGEWSMPGGGWDHGEDYKDCIRREVTEELGATVAHIGPMAFFYRCHTLHGKPKISLTFPVTLEDFTFAPNDDEVAEVDFVTKQDFTRLPFEEGEAPVQAYADQIWTSVEKSRENR